MKYIFIFWLTLGLVSGAAAQQLPPDLLADENFQDNRRGWYTGSNADWDVTLDGGEYRLSSKPGGGRFSWIPLALNTSADFVIEAELSNTAAGGLVWGAKSGNDAPLFATVAGGFAVCGWREGKFYSSNGAQYQSAAVRPLGEWNTLRISRVGEVLHYAVNGTAVWQEPFVASRVGPLFGFQTDGVTVVRARRLRVWHHSPVKNVPGLPAGLRRERLGPQVNFATHNDGAPVLSPDGQELYYSHWRPDSPKQSDILLSRRRPDGSWGAAENLGAPLNNGGYNCPMGITPDGQTMLLINHYRPDGSPASTGGCSLTRRGADGRWGLPEPVTIPGLPAQVSYYYFNLAADGLTLVMAFGDAAVPGSGDLYVSHRAPDGQWSRAQSLGAVVNSAGQENSPFLAPDGRTLYFASDGHPGYGGSDIFVSRRLDDSWTKWSEPLNLGPGINSPGMDACYTLSAAGDYAYLCSKEWPEPLEDIFRVKLPEAARPAPTLLVRGRVLDARSGQPIAGASIFSERLPDGSTTGTAHSAANTGAYQLVLPSGQPYGFRATASGYLSVNENVDLTNTRQYGEVTQDLLLMPILPPTEALTATTPKLNTGPAAALPATVQGVAAPAPVAEAPIALHNVFFVQSKPVLLPGSFPELARLAQTLQEHPSLRLRLDGHTDNGGDPKANLVLSQQRVAALKAYLVKQGVAESRLETQGWGDTRPVAPNDSEANKRKNRRVEFVILSR